MTDELVHLAVRSGVAVITLDSPANRNALSAQLRAELRGALTRSAEDDAARVVVIDHIGPVFCSGMDLKEPGDHGVTELPGLLEQIWTHPKPVVVKLAGPARAGGVGLVAAADIAVATQHATFAFTEVRLGLVPAVISVAVLPRLLPRAASELFLTGDTVDATRAVAAGLLTRAVPADQLDAEVDRYTGMLIRGAPEALMLTKQLLRRPPAPTAASTTAATPTAAPAAAASTVAGEFAAMLELSAARFASAEGQEGIRAFIEKRPPSWAAHQP